MSFTSRVLAALEQADLLGPPAQPTNQGNLTSKPAVLPERSKHRTRAEERGQRLAPRKRSEQSRPPDLPVYSYKDYKSSPVVVYTRDEDEADEIVQTMKGPLGFDMEWVFFYRARVPVSRKTAVVQISDDNIILIMQISAMRKFPPEVKKVIESRDIVKLGVNIRNDGEKLFNDYGIFAANLVELGGVANQADPTFASEFQRPMVALAKMVRFYEQKLLPKGPVRSSNWETVPLTDEQLGYAANDAHCAVVMYKKLMSISVANERVLCPQRYTSDLGEEHKAGKLILRSSPLPPLPNKPQEDSMTPVLNDTTAPKEAEPAPSPQFLRTYTLWHQRKMALPDMCATLRTKENPLKYSTVISYIVRALQNNPSLPFDMVRLRDLIYQELGSWERHGAWLLEMDRNPRQRAS